MNRSGPRASGMTLVEVVIAIVVVAISLSGTLLLVDTTTRRSADPMIERQSISIAQAYLEEILAKDFYDPDDGTLCPAAEAARSLFDNVCDYDGLDELGARDQTGTIVTGLDGYRIEIDLDTSTSLGTLSGPSEIVRVDATVTDPLGGIVRVSAYRSNS